MSIWPTIPVIFLGYAVFGHIDDDSAIAVLEHPDRVSRIRLFGNESQLLKITALMQEPFPVLTHLSISSQFRNILPLPDGLLGGFAPSLQQLNLGNVLYPALPTLLLSACNLVDLRLHNILPTGYISPEAMVSHVSTSPKLETLYIQFKDPPSFSNLIISPPLTRTIFPALRIFSFIGKCEYLEDCVSRIDTPQLNYLFVCYQSENINFDVPQLSKFINRSENLKRSLSRHCKITVDQDPDVLQDIVTFCLGRTTSERRNHRPSISVCLETGIKEKFLHLTNILGFIFPILSDVVHCTIYSDNPASSSEPEGRDDFDWLQLLRQLSSLQTLIVFGNVTCLISQALARVDVGTITEILPALQLLCLEGSEEGQATSSVHKFLAVRWDSGHPVTFVKTKEEFEEKLKSHP